MKFRVSNSIVAIALSGVLSVSKADELNFNRDIRPILSSNCFECHGPDAKNRKADLRLDQQDGIRAVFEVEELADSDAWQRLISSDDDYRMPPADSHKDLQPDEIQKLKTWIQQGAKWQGHWSFIRPLLPEVPSTSNSKWIRTPIDAFILAELEKSNLTPNKDASKEMLIRRVTFDLTGLPPTLQEIDAFFNDHDSKAFERVVDRLLDSPHFGERMALAWMDLARYGDSSVFHADGPRYMWPWRDWVINAYNANKPFDEFTIEQLAGDLIPNATQAQRVASGFNRNNATTDEGGAIAEEFRVEYAVDRVNTTGTVWMALSVQCAQCHDHKYDPISQEEYYQFFAYFNQASDPGMQTRNGNQSPVTDVHDPQNLKRAEELKPHVAALQEKLARRKKEAERDFQEWLAANQDAETTTPPTDSLVLHVDFDEKPKAKRLVSLTGSVGKAHGKFQDRTGLFGKAIRVDNNFFVDFDKIADFEHNEKFSYGAWVRPAKHAIGAVLARMDEGKQFRGYDLIINQKNGAIEAHFVHAWPDNAIKVVANNKLAADQWHHVFVTYDGSSKAAGVKIFVNGESQKLETQNDNLDSTIRIDTSVRIGRRNPGQKFIGDIDEVRLYDRILEPSDVQQIANEKPIDRLLAANPETRTPEQRAAIRTHYLNTHDNAYVQTSKELANTEAEIAKLIKPVSTVMVMKDVGKPRMTYILDRGNYDSPKKDQPVEPKTLSALPELPDDALKNRLGMATWLVQPNHPLTARVAVNRYWYMIFGTGIVKTVDDFGSQGDWPSHPELLDWLAVDFMQNGWDIKHTLKQMVLSSTYRQSSKISALAQKTDPNNRLLSHGPRFRLAGEFIRDNALAASGLLVTKIGGPSVKPYQPPGLWNEVSLSGNVRFKQDHGAALYRRSLYTYWKRSAPAPSLTIFDTPSREKCVVQRSRTNTPLQALVTLNDVQFVEAARALAQRSISDGGNNAKAWITHAFRSTTSRQPSKKTLSTLINAYHEELKVFSADLDRAKSLLTIGESKRDEKIDAAQHAAMTIVTSMILNLDQTLTKG